MAEPVLIGPFPLTVKARGNIEIGRNAGDFGRSTKGQRARVAAAMSGSCSRCGQLPTAIQVQLHRGGRKFWRAHEGCKCRAPRRPHQLPPHGPEHPVDVHLVRVPERWQPLDEHDGLPIALKAVADEVAAQLWPKGPDGKPVSKPDDSAPWLRWSYGQRPRRKYLNPRPHKLPPGYVPGPPDQPNKGTELVEIWIAPREDCPCCGRSMLPVRWQRGEL